MRIWKYSCFESLGWADEGIYSRSKNQPKDKYGNEKKLIEKTEIEVQYLPEADIKKVREGIIVFSKQDLNKIIEDYE